MLHQYRIFSRIPRNKKGVAILVLTAHSGAIMARVFRSIVFLFAVLAVISAESLEEIPSYDYTVQDNLDEAGAELSEIDDEDFSDRESSDDDFSEIDAAGTEGDGRPALIFCYLLSLPSPLY